ncbi:hypothetical protein QBC38DRAFT_471556 [Podospora fimiseda]|uniref:Uncharacterized protein n=1 Tax=Podospora fimiseda TaxID=252190 RepID=A0AAN7BUS3_9PEZI|nr:hypothetical protein QBC38DRAFT_471556 [Podospora fimiseda]
MKLLLLYFAVFAEISYLYITSSILPVSPFYPSPSPIYPTKPHILAQTHRNRCKDLIGTKRYIYLSLAFPTTRGLSVETF